MSDVREEASGEPVDRAQEQITENDELRTDEPITEPEPNGVYNSEQLNNGESRNEGTSVQSHALPVGNQDSSDNDENNVRPSHRNIGQTTNERQPLLKKSSKKARVKGRNLQLHPEDYQSTENQDDDDFLDADFYSNNGRFQVHKNYITFLNNWKTILNVILFINSILLITIFVSEFFVEILPTDGIASFNNFILILIALTGNCFNLWFNKIGLFSPFDLHLNVVLTALPLINLLILFGIQYTRERINTISIVIHLWTSLTFSLGLIQAYNLRRYIRNLAPPTTHNKHTITEWFEIGFRNIIKFVSLILLVLLILNTFLHVIDVHNTVAHLSKDTSKFVWANPEHTKRLHISCYGIDNDNYTLRSMQQPIVLFEHGGEDTAYTSGVWIEELYNLGKIDRYCIYDRFGYGLSDSVAAPASLKKSAEGLSYSLINELKLNGPFLVVGYDYGALVARVFAAENRGICSGLMLVEGWNEELLLKHYLRRIFPGSGDDDDNNDDRKHNDKINYKVVEREIGKRYTIRSWIYGIWSSFGLNLQSSWFISHHGSMVRIFGKDMLEEGGFIRNKVLESITSSISSSKDILEANMKIRDIRLSIVSSKQFIKKSSIWGNWQRKLTKISSKTMEWKIIEGEHQFYDSRIGIEETQDVLLRLINE